MTFALPHLLWLALAPLALLGWELTHRRRTDTTTHPKILRAEAGDRGLKLAGSDAAAGLSGHRGRARPWLCLGLVFCVIAAARPQWGRIEEPVFEQAREIIIAIDLSRSMLTPDIKPSRLDRAKLLTQALLERLNGERIGLVVFSGTAFLQSPLSADYEILREFLPALDPHFLPEGGTNYRALIDTSLAAFASTAAADRFLIVLSDGESTVDDWRERIQELKTKDIRVIGLGVGTTAGAMIPDGSGGLVKDERGAVVLSKLEPATLQELASSTNGVYQDASNWIDLATLVEATVEAGRKGEFTEKNSVRLVERFQWPLALGLWLLLVSLYHEFPVRPKPRDLKFNPVSPDARGARRTAPNPPAPPPEITVAALCLLASLLCSPTSTRAASAGAPPAATPPEPPPLARIVGRLSESPNRTARDWAELSRETVTWGSRLQSSQEAVPEGPVRDALAAVELGSRLDPKTADWPKLRQELEALLTKPEDQQQQQQQNQDDQQQQDRQKQDQSKQDQSKEGDPQQQQQKDQQEQQPGDSSQQKEQNPSKSDQQKSAEEQESAFGDMKDQQPPPPPPQETQKVGGVPERKEGDPPPPDPALALPLQKLDQLKSQDSPAELFKLMEGDKNQTPRTRTKDW